MENIIYKTLIECATLEVSTIEFAIKHEGGYCNDDNYSYGTVVKFTESTGVVNSVSVLQKALERRGYGARVTVGQEDWRYSNRTPESWWQNTCEPLFIVGGDRYICIGVHYSGEWKGYYAFQPLSEWLSNLNDSRDED